MASADAGGPRAGFKRYPEGTSISPDKTIPLEQYSKVSDERGALYQFWTFDKDHRHAYLLNPARPMISPGMPPDFDLARIASGWYGCRNSERAIKRFFYTAGTAIVFHPRCPTPSATWPGIIFFTTPTSKGMHRDPENPYGLDHAFVALIKGMEENYAWMGQHWPESRYVVISRSFDMQGEEVKAPWIEDWHCVYDLKTGAFSVPRLCRAQCEGCHAT